MERIGQPRGNAFRNKRPRLHVLYYDCDLELRNTVSNWNELRSTPNETINLHSSETLLESLHVSLVIPWLDIESDDGLGSWLWTLCGLLGLVLSDTLGLDSCSLCVLLLVIRAEEVDLVLVLAHGNGLSGVGLDAGSVNGREERGSLGLVTWEVWVLSLEGGNVGEPSGDVWELLGVWSLDAVKDCYVGL